MAMKLSQSMAASLQDPALNGRWFVNIENGPGPRSLLVEAVSPSFPKVAARPRFGGGRSFYFPDVADIDGIPVVFYETRNYDATAWLTEWQKRVYDPETGSYGVPKGPRGYWKTLEVQFFAYEDETPVLSLTYEGCWPTDKQPFELSYAEMDGRLTVGAQLAVHKVTHKRRLQGTTTGP